MKLRLRCGHWSRKTNLECARPRGHRGKHRFTVVPRFFSRWGGAWGGGERS